MIKCHLSKQKTHLHYCASRFSVVLFLVRAMLQKWPNYTKIEKSWKQQWKILKILQCDWISRRRLLVIYFLIKEFFTQKFQFLVVRRLMLLYPFSMLCGVFFFSFLFPESIFEENVWWSVTEMPFYLSEMNPILHFNISLLLSQSQTQILPSFSFISSFAVEFFLSS